MKGMLPSKYLKKEEEGEGGEGEEDEEEDTEDGQVADSAEVDSHKVEVAKQMAVVQYHRVSVLLSNNIHLISHTLYIVY